MNSKPGVLTRLASAFSVFQDPQKLSYQDYGRGSFGSSHLPYLNNSPFPSTGSIVTPIYNRIAIDVASIGAKHVRLNEDGRYVEDIHSYLNECLTLDPNIDQIAPALFRDAVMSLCRSGSISIVPVETSRDPMNGSFDIHQLRVAQNLEFYPRHVRVKVWNDSIGDYEELVLPKTFVAVVENPLFSVMNQQNSLLQRLLRKLHLLDNIDEMNNNGRLDLIIQLPYQTKTAARKEQADKRREEMERQLADGKNGVVYTDVTERVVQLNRPIDNTLLAQVDSLTNQLYGQLGITKEVIDGTADEAVMINYFNRTVEPILSAITLSMKRTFLTKTARTQGQSIEFYRDPFKLMPLSQIAELADKFTRNEIASSNDIRTEALGWKPSKDPKADKLINSNINQSKNSNEDDNVIDAEVVDDDNEPKKIER